MSKPTNWMECYLEIAKAHRLPVESQYFFDVSGAGERLRGNKLQVSGIQLRDMLLRGARQTLPGLNLRPRRRALAGLRPGHYKMLEYFGGQAIWHRPQARVLACTDVGRVLKIWRRGASDSDKLRDVVAMRERLQQRTQLGLPKLFDYSLSDTQAWVLEELCAGRPVSLHPDEPAVARRLFGQMIAAYDRFGCHRARFTEVLPEDGLQSLATQAHGDPAWPRFESALAQVVRADPLLPVSYCHNDLHRHNVVVDHQSRIKIIDWDYASAQAPVVTDFLRIPALERLCPGPRLPVTFTAACALLAFVYKGAFRQPILPFWDSVMARLS